MLPPVVFAASVRYRTFTGSRSAWRPLCTSRFNAPDVSQ
jgi:hypothetical protein